jgi:hypothetical protein
VPVCAGAGGTTASSTRKSGSKRENMESGRGEERRRTDSLV